VIGELCWCFVMGVWMYHEKCSIQFTCQNGDWRGITLKFQLSLLVRMLQINFFFILNFVAWHSQFVYFFYYDHKINGNGACVF
jgi:hypothetical protein